jgi:hypothetical protein
LCVRNERHPGNSVNTGDARSVSLSATRHVW